MREESLELRGNCVPASGKRILKTSFAKRNALSPNHLFKNVGLSFSSRVKMNIVSLFHTRKTTEKQTTTQDRFLQEQKKLASTRKKISLHTMENTSKRKVSTQKVPANSAFEKSASALKSGGDEGSRTPVFRPFGGNVYTLSRPLGFR